MSWLEKSNIQLSAIIPITATSPPGTDFTERPKTIRIASTAAETSVVCQEASPMSHSVSPNLRTVPLNAFGGDVRGRDAEHPAHLPHRHLDADARQETDEHRSRQEVREEAEPRDPGEEEEPGREQRAEARQCEPLCGCWAAAPRCRDPRFPRT